MIRTQQRQYMMLRGRQIEAKKKSGMTAKMKDVNFVKILSGMSVNFDCFLHASHVYTHLGDSLPQK